MLTLGNCVALSIALFCVGAYGVVARRNLIVVLLSVEVMLNAANLCLLAFSRHFAFGGSPAGGAFAHVDAGGGQVLVLMSMAVAACEVAVGLALLIALFRRKNSVLSTSAARLRG
ncbi:MAG: NADH-quinone oxidoreductase subunit NuoK [Planctomycetota bacterium]|jgi:NADH-quinone oxidoreductase subunit K